MPRYGRCTYLLLALSLFASSGCSKSDTKLQPSFRADHIVVTKSQHTLTLFKNGNAIKTYRVSLGRGRGQAKRMQGDHETPEGSYTIDRRNDKSHFYRALHISYPDQNDKRSADSKGVSPGGDIMIHGLRNGLGWLGPIHRSLDWTDGCIAVTDSEMDEIWKAVPTGTSVEIVH